MNAKTLSGAGVPEQDLLTPAQLSAWLQVPLCWPYNKLREPSETPLPVIKLGRYLRFSRKAVQQWLESQSVAVKSSATLRRETRAHENQN